MKLQTVFSVLKLSKLGNPLLLLKPTFSHNRFSHSLLSRIKLCGPITVADYMSEVLTNPQIGYYMKKDVFGNDGDFITSPEITQLFGEMIAIWILNEWYKIGAPKPFQLIELGPGRGTMMSDILRIFSKLGLSQDDVSVNLVEVSDELSKIQGSNLCNDYSTSSKTTFYQEGITRNGVPIYWFHNLLNIPNRFSIIVAHEFFDALPIHKFQKTDKGWREILVDIDPKSPNNVRYVLSNVATPSSILLKKSETRQHVEISPASGLIMEHIATRLESHGGFALIADYGHLGEKEDTFRGFRKHKLHDPLIEPGTADLTADVDFSYLKYAVGDKLVAYGPVAQRDFLKRLHIDVRLKKLQESAKTKDDSDNLVSGYNMIMSETGMGNAFRFMSFFPAVLEDFLKTKPVAGFSDS